MTTMKIEYEEGHRTKIQSLEGGSSVYTDVPQAFGGKGKEMSPTDLFAASLGSCILSVMGLQAKKLGISLQGAKALVTKNQGSIPGGIGEITVHVYFSETLSHEVQQKLEKAAKTCPVHNCIDAKVKQEVVFHWGESP